MKQNSKSTKKQTAILQDYPRDQHQFILRPISSHCYYSQTSTLDCFPHYNKNAKKYLNIWPEINTDGNYYMPFFTLEIDKETLYKKQSDYKQTHDTRVQNALQSKNQMLVPHPGKSRRTCFVCRSHFNDYKTHIETKAHKQKLRNGRNQFIIQELVAKVSSQHFDMDQGQPRQLGELIKQTKRQRKDQRLRVRQQIIVQQVQSQQVYELKIQLPTEPSVIKNQENKMLLNLSASNIEQFKVSDYLF